MPNGLLPPAAAAAATTQPDAGPVQPGVAPVAAAPSQPTGVPQVQRDYQANPINQEDMDNVNKFTIMATKVIHTPQTREKILGRIKGVQHPYDEIADASLVVMNRIEQEAQKEGQPWDQAVKLMGGTSIVEQVVELASAAGKIPPEIPEDDKKIILGQAVQKYYQQKISSGEMTKQQAAEEAHMAAQVQAQMSGQDISGTNKRLEATNNLKQQGGTAAAQAGVNPQGMPTPVPAADPMNPETTMKQVLATGKGGLLDA